MTSDSLRAVLIAVFFAISGSAIGATGDDDWDAGKRAFRDGDYASALVFFETARDAGLGGPAVHYNIAVSQYKLGRYAAADATFGFIAQRFPKMRALAEYNLGLTATRLGNVADASSHFRKAHELSGNDRTLRVLASSQLRVVEPETLTASRWTGVFGVSAGYDDNVALLDETALSAGTTTDSPLVDVYAAVSGPWSGGSGLRVEGSVYLLKYTDADDFDQSEIQGGIFYHWARHNWRLQLGAQLGTGAIGGDAFDRKVGPSARAVYYLSRNANIDLRYRYDDVTEADSVFAGLAGSRQQFDVRYRWYRDGHRLQLRFVAEMNDRLDAGMSPDRNRIAIDYRFRPERGFGLEAGLALRNSDYDEIAMPRDEDLTTLRSAVSYGFRNDWRVSVEYRDSSNDSTDPVYDYDRGQLTLGVLKVF